MSSTRSNTRFLYSVLESQLTGQGFALSLTLRDCPPTSEEWKRLRDAFFVRLRRRGLIRAHWLTEWQRRGCPHMHAAVWLPEGVPAPSWAREIRSAWVEVSGAYGSAPRGQHVVPITDEVGWFQYLSKHASRGLSHYQRSSEGIPAGWLKTGRMWGYLGEWPRLEAEVFELDNAAFWALRRIVRRYRLADAREALRNARPGGAQIIALRRIRQARAMLQDRDRVRGSLRGVSEWIEADMQLRILMLLAATGHQVRHRETGEADHYTAPA